MEVVSSKKSLSLILILCTVVSVSAQDSAKGDCSTRKDHNGELMTWQEFCNNVHNRECVTDEIYVKCGNCLPEYDNWMNKLCKLKTCDSNYNDEMTWNKYCSALESNCQETDKGPICSDPCESKPCLYGECGIDQDNNDFYCKCYDGFSGKLCEIPFCSSDCGNEASCQAIDGKPVCYCSSFELVFDPSDKLCKDPCVGIPCQNGGTCVGDPSAPEGFKCICLPGFHGDGCEEFQCNPQCPDDATCEIIDSKSVCICIDMNLVYFQDQNKCRDPCEQQSCNGKGTCTVDLTVNEKFKCECDDGYHGTHCELQHCNPACPSDADCKKVDENDSFQCECHNADYIFDTITETCGEIEKNPCNPNPCKNGGTCTPNWSKDDGNLFTCRCPDGFSGPTCEYSDDLCSPNPCMNGGTCSTWDEWTYTCACADGFSGIRCENQKCQPECPLNEADCKINNEEGVYQCVCKEDGFVFDPVENGCKDPNTNPCEPNPCQNGGICCQHPVTSETAYLCSCLNGYAGSLCQFPFCQPSCPTKAQCTIVNTEEGTAKPQCICSEEGFQFNQEKNTCEKANEICRETKRKIITVVTEMTCTSEEEMDP